MVIHIRTFRPQFVSISAERKSNASTSTYDASQGQERACFYCHKSGHVIANCLALKHKEQMRAKQSSLPKGISLIKEERKRHSLHNVHHSSAVDECFNPFWFDELVSVSGECKNKQSVRMSYKIRHGYNRLFSSVLPFSDQSACGYSSILCGVEMGYIVKPVHQIHIESELVMGFFEVSVFEDGHLLTTHAGLYPACVVSQAQEAN